MGHIVTNKGLRPDPEKAKAIKEMPCPVDLKGVQRLGEFVNYLTKFLPHIADVIAPMRNLTKADVLWTWSQIDEDAFGKIKKLVSELLVLRYYNHSEPLIIECDTSEKVLRAALLQEGQQ